MNWTTGLKRLLILVTTLWVFGWGWFLYAEYTKDYQYDFMLYSDGQPSLLWTSCSDATHPKVEVIVVKEINRHRYDFYYCSYSHERKEIEEIAKQHTSAMTADFVSDLKKTEDTKRQKYIMETAKGVYGFMIGIFVLYFLVMWLYRGFIVHKPNN